MGIEEKKKHLGCNKAPDDARDFILRSPKWMPETLEYVDYTDQMLPVKDQGDELTCVGFAASAMKEWQERMELGGKELKLSPRFVYEHARKIDDIPDEMGGTNLRSAMKILRKQGICTEELWPYTGEASENIYSEADKYRIASYGKIPSIMDKRSALITNGPFVVGVEVFDTWYSAEVEEKGVIPDVNGDENMGGHAICVVGYDDKNRLFKFRNSWSERWGDGGYGYIPYDYMEKHSWDAWTSVDITVPYIPKDKKDTDEEEGLKEIVKEMMRDLIAEQTPELTSDASITEIIIRISSTEEE